MLISLHFLKIVHGFLTVLANVYSMSIPVCLLWLLRPIVLFNWKFISKAQTSGSNKFLWNISSLFFCKPLFRFITTIHISFWTIIYRKWFLENILPTFQLFQLVLAPVLSTLLHKNENKDFCQNWSERRKKSVITTRIILPISSKSSQKISMSNK